jgi:hypothetical protein
MPRKPTAKKYTGILAKPRKPWGPLSLLDTEEEIARRAKVDAEEISKRLQAILLHYKIDPTAPTAFVQLLFRLLEGHVPGFRVARGRGREPFWTVHRIVDLVFDVQRILNTGKPASAAFQNPEIQKRYQAKDAQSLRRRYEEHRRDPIITAFEALARHSEGRLTFAEMAEIHYEEVTAKRVRE